MYFMFKKSTQFKSTQKEGYMESGGGHVVWVLAFIYLFYIEARLFVK